MKNSASDLRCVRHHTVSPQSWGNTLDSSSSVLTKRSLELRSCDRGTVDSQSGRLRQRKPQPLAPRPCACPVRTSAPSRHRATSAPAYHSSYLRNYHSFNNRSYPHPLSAGSSKGGMQRERQVAGPACRTRQSPAQARLLVPARGTENCKQSSCCCAVVR